MDENFKTSQTEWSLPEGKGGGSVPVQYGSEPQGAPGPVTEPIKGETFKIDAMQTSQQKAGEYHNPAD